MYKSNHLTTDILIIGGGTAGCMAAIFARPGVLDVRRVRLRKSGPETFADVTFTVGREASFERSHEIGMAAREAIRRVLPGADVVIHAQPVARGEEGTLVAVRLAAARLGLAAHAIRLSGDGPAQALECHLEVPESLTLAEAHQVVVGAEHHSPHDEHEEDQHAEASQPLHTKAPSLSTVIAKARPARSRAVDELIRKVSPGATRRTDGNNSSTGASP